MSVDQNTSNTKKKLPRDQDPDYIWNPKTRRWVKKSGRVYQQMLLDNVAGLNPDDRKGNILAVGTTQELQILHNKLKDNKQFIGTGKELSIKGDKLCIVRKKVHKKDIRAKLKQTERDIAIENRELFQSDLTNDQITFLLGKICDCKLMGKPIDVQAEVNQLLGIREQLKVMHTTAPIAKKRQVKRKPRSRFRVLPAPETEIEET